MEKTAGENKRIQIKGAVHDLHEKDIDQVATIMKFNKKLLFNWTEEYNFCRLAVFRLKTSKTSGSKSSSIFIILPEKAIFLCIFIRKVRLSGGRGFVSFRCIFGNS